MVPVDGNPQRLVAVELRQVTFKDCGVGEHAVHSGLEVESRHRALKRLWRWISYRTMSDRSQGWFSGAALRGHR